jgi:hypothetical protein
VSLGWRLLEVSEGSLNGEPSKVYNFMFFFFISLTLAVFFLLCIHDGGDGGLERGREYKTIARKSSIKNNVIAYFTLILACTPETCIEVFLILRPSPQRKNVRKCDVRGGRKFS